MDQRTCVNQIHRRVRECFTRHQFKTFGDALDWLHKEDTDILELEAGEQGYSKFSIDILWLISQFGPNTVVDHEIMDVPQVSTLRKVKVEESEEQDDEEYKVPPPSKKKTSVRKRRRRRRF